MPFMILKAGGGIWILPGEMRGWRLLRKNINSVLGYYGKVKTDYRVIMKK